jgi:hypothetical protein
MGAGKARPDPAGRIEDLPGKADAAAAALLEPVHRDRAGVM